MKMAQGSPQQKQQRKSFSDFANEYEGKVAAVRLYDGSELKGLIYAVERYFIKMQVGSRVLYINKAYVVSIEVIA